MDGYRLLHRAQLTFEYLHTNSTTHEFLFGAIAEMIDNSRDAGSTSLRIYTKECSAVRGGFILCFLDDGCGMDPDETLSVISFGKSNKRGDETSNAIGNYGNGLKSGSMRIGNDLMLFTKKNKTLTCLLLSRTFHESEGLREVVVPVPTFSSRTQLPMLRNGKCRTMHETEMDVIFKYGPFKNIESLMAEFNLIEGETGTLVLLFNVKLMQTSIPELDIVTDREDILLSNEDKHEAVQDYILYPERRSLRSYVSILYYDPHMKIYIQGKKVRTTQLIYKLHKVRQYQCSSTRFRASTEKRCLEAKSELAQIEERLRETESKVIEAQRKLDMTGLLGNRSEVNRIEMQLFEHRKIHSTKVANLDKCKKLLNEPKILTFTFGLNVENRRRDGIFVFNCSRLIRMYERSYPGASTDKIHIPGIVGIVNISKDVIEPTHNKQNFADAREYRYLLRCMYEFMQVYSRDIMYEKTIDHKFWTRFGYAADEDWFECSAPSDAPKFVRKRTFVVPIVLQCDKCLKWRTLAFGTANNVFPDDWDCTMNPDPDTSKCDVPEKLPKIDFCCNAEHKPKRKIEASAIVDEDENEIATDDSPQLETTTTQYTKTKSAKSGTKRVHFCLEEEDAAAAADLSTTVKLEPVDQTIPAPLTITVKREHDQFRASNIIHCSSMQKSEILKKVKCMLQYVLKYILPKQYHLTGRDIERMNCEELATFDIDALIKEHCRELNDQLSVLGTRKQDALKRLEESERRVKSIEKLLYGEPRQIN